LIVKKPDELLNRINAFVGEKGGGVLVRKLAGGYSLYLEESGRPVARF
jgi:hypothetical protein